jgi:hypothetical protein
MWRRALGVRPASAAAWGIDIKMAGPTVGIEGRDGVGRLIAPTTPEYSAITLSGIGTSQEMGLPATTTQAGSTRIMTRMFYRIR